MCVQAGYTGSSDEQIIEQWFEDVATEEYYKHILDSSNEEDRSSIIDNFGSVPSTHTTHERIDGTKTKHS